jgi:hypothetical protein
MIVIKCYCIFSDTLVHLVSDILSNNRLLYVQILL